MSRPTPSAAPHAAPNQFALLRQRRYAPFFWAMFLGSGNDNLFKFAFTVLVTYQLQVSWLPPSLAGAVIGAVFILPFVLFSATSGQLADKLDKAAIVRATKWLEIGVMLLAAGQGTPVTVRIDGEDEAAAMQEVVSLFERRFDEDA